MEMNIKRKMMYTRVAPAFVSRNGRRCSLGMVIGACLLLSTLCFILTFVTPTGDHKSNVNARLAELPSWGFNQSLNLLDYIDPWNGHSFIWTPRDMTSNSNSLPPYCGGGSNKVKLLILVTSAPSHFSQRQVIRETWGSPTELQDKSAVLYFVLGRSVNETYEDDVGQEVKNYGDILEEDYLDTYHNLTLKSISILKFINLTCFTGNLTSMPYHVLKVDDDVFVNIERLFSVIHDMPGAKMIGRLICGAEPITDTNSKLFMPQYLYPARAYPGYLSGTAYLLAGEIVPVLLDMAMRVPLIHMEDIWVTGLVARKCGIYPEDSPYFTYLKVDSQDMCVLKEMVSSHTIQPPEMRKIWTLWKNTTTSDCASILTPKLRRKLIRRPVPRYKNMNKRLKKLCQFPI